MALKINSDQQRIQASGATPTGNWVNATYSRTVNGVVTILSVAHGFINNEKLYIDFTSGGEVDGTYTVTKVDDDNLQFTSSNLGVITAGNTLAYRRVRSLSIQGDESLELSVGVDANEKDAVTLNLNPQNNIRVGVNTTDPQYELDVEGQIRTTRSIISDTAQVVNLDIQTIINPALDLRAPNLINYEDTDVTSPTFGTVFYPTADTPPLTDQSRRLATTDFVYKVATNDTGGRVYVSATIGSDLNDGRSAARPVKTVKKAAQIAYTLQKAQPDPSDEYVSLIVSGGEYFEDNPISLPRNCSLIGDNLRRVILRPQNADRHMIKASNETYVFGVVFRDALQNSSDPQSTVIHTWKYAFVFDDKQRLYYEPELAQIPAIPGDKFRGDNIFKITFTNHTGNNTTLQTGYFVQGGSSGTLGTIQSINFTGPQASPYSTGSVTILITSGINDVFQSAEKIFYDAVAANIVTDLNNNPSDRFDVADAESLRPELETISNQIYQHTVNSERETVAFAADISKVNTTTDVITITGHTLKTGDQVYYQKDENAAALGGLIDSTLYYVRFIDANSIALYDTWLNATTTTSTSGRKDITGVSPDTSLHLFTTGKIMPEGNHIFIDTHQYATGDGVIYRSSKMGGIGGLVEGTTYYVYKENTNWIRLAASAANALNKDAQGNDDPITLPLTGTGKGYQRFEDATKLLSISTIDTSLSTQQTYNGPTFTLAGTSYHDYEVGQEVIMYGFQSSAINFGSSTNTSWSLASGEVTVTISTADNGLTTALFGNWISLGECGLKFNFSGTGSEALSKTYHIDNFSLGSGTPSLPGNTALGMGYARYNSSNTTVTFVLKAANIQSTSNTATASGSTVSILDNVGDLNGRKYITHRIERADGYALQFVVRASVSVFNATLNPTGNQSVISSSNYVLASLRNSPYGFTKISQTDRFRDGAESIRQNQEFIAEEAYGYVKSHYEKSDTRNSTLVIGPTTFSALGMEFDHPITTWTVNDDVATIKVNQGHNLYRGYKNHNHIYNGGTASNAITITQGSVQKNVTNATYDPVTGDLVLTIGAHSYTTANTLTIANGALSFTCSRDNHNTSHTYPRATDPAYGATLAITAVDAAGTVTVNVGTSAGVEIKGVAAFANGFSLNSTWPIKDIVDHRTFTLDLGVNSSGKNAPVGTTYTGTDGTFTDLRKPFRTPNSFPENNKQADAAELLAANAEMIAEVSVERMVANTGYSVPTGNTACTDDIKDFLQKSLYHNLKWGGNDRVYDAANYFLKYVTTSNQSKYVEAFNYAKGYAAKVIRNLPILRHPHTTHPQQYEITTLDRATYGTVPNLTQDAANLINANNKFISEEAVERFISSLTDVAVESVSGNDITINALNGTTPTNTTPHTYQGVSTYQFTPTDADYNPLTGYMVLTIAGHPFVDGDRVQFAPDSLTFTCEMDNGVSNKTYPRTSDPFYNKWVGVQKVDANNIKVNVGKAVTDVTPHTFVSASANAVTRAVVYNDTGFTQHTVTGASYEPITGILTLTIPNHGFTVGEKVQVAQDSLTFTCEMDDNFSKHTYPRATDPALNVWKSIGNVTQNSFTIDVGTTPPVTFTPTNAVYTPTTGLMEVTIGNHTLEGATSHTVTGATLDVTTGVMTVTVNNHGFQEGDKINVAQASIQMSCGYSGGGNESYPKAGQYANGKWLNIWNVTQNTFDFDCTGGVPLSVSDAHTFVSATANSLQHVKEHVRLTNGAITFKCAADGNSTEHSYPRTVIDSHTATTGTTYNPTTGIMSVTTTAPHGMRNGDWIKMSEGSITFSCAFGGASGPASQKAYPRSTDPIAGKWQKIFNVTASTFDVQVLASAPSTNTDTHTFVSATTGGISQKRDKSYQTAVPIVSVTGTTITLDVGISSNTTAHVYQSALSNSVISGGNYAHTFVSATSNGVKRATASSINNYTPGAGSYNPTTGVLTLTIGANDLTAPTTHTSTGGAYNPSTGIMTVTVNNHGFKAGDKVKFDVGAISFSCTHGSGGTTAYPRSTDPIANKWINCFNVTTNTFDVLVLDTIPSTNTTTHTYVSSAPNAISRATSTIKIAQESLQLSCTHGGGGTSSYPRSTDPIANPRFTIPNHNQDCKDDCSDVLRAVAYNIVNGGNDAVYDHAGYFVGTTHVDGEEFQARAVFELASEITQQVIANETVNVKGWHGVEQTKDLTITVDVGGCATPKSTVDTLFSIVEQAIINDSLSHATDTAATTPTCTDVVSAIDTFFGIVTTALGTDGSYGNLNAVTRTFSTGDQQCLDDILHVLRAFQYDLRYGGNSKTVEAANKYILGGAVNHVTQEVDYTRAIFAYAKELAIKAIRNDLESGFFSQITPTSNGSITVDSSAPECANVVSALTTNWGILDNVLSSATLYSGTITNPDPLISEQDGTKYTFPLLNIFLDLPVIEASPYIQNSSLISFLGGSGCDIDGAKVATPNVPRPGLKLNSQGNTVAQFDPQGKSMVANAFTIICFGGTAYNVTNDGYTQLVSVFAIFCQDGIVCQSGGYASVTNSASNFGTFSLRATGFRAEPYSFDIGVIDSITNDADNNNVESGRQIIQVSGTTLTNIPVEDYIIRIGDVTPTDPAVEHIILETEVVSGAPGSQIVAKITTNRSMDYTLDASPNTRYSYANGNLSGLVGKSIQFHRPSVCNSSSHTWEFSGSGNTYAALPQNGGFGLGSAYEAAEESFGQVYTSGTNEFGDFKVGNFVTIFNRTGAISFVGTVSISELSSIKIVGGAITITGFSDDDNLGGTFASDSLLPTQASVRDYISNNLGPYLNQPYSTNAVPSALVQLTSSGKINIDQIPALRPFNITSVASQAERLAIEDASAGDIAIETTATSFSVAPASVNTSNEQITITGHGTNTGDGLTYTAGTSAIGNLSTATKYFVIKVDDNTVKLATTSSNATNGSAIDLTGQGTGTHTFTTDGTAISYILENDLESQFLAFTPNSNYSFTNGAILTGSSTTARGTIQSYNDGLIYNFVISDGGNDYTGDFALTISAPGGSGTQATATANVVSGVVTKVTITNPGSGYFSQPTVTAPNSPTNNNAVIAAQIEGRVNIDIANNIKFDAGDFILDGANANEGTGTYAQSGTTITINENAHNLSNAALAYLDFTSGGAADGFYTISLINANQYTVTSATSATNSGNVSRKRIIDLTRVINTSATNLANWTQLTSTNIDASNIVAGTIDPERLAGKGTANSYTFLRGDSSWEYALQSIRPTTQDAIVIGGSLTDSTYIDSITITNGGTGYTNGTYQNIPLEGGNVSVTDSGVARATYIVAGGVITSAQVTDSGTGYNAGFSITIPSELGGGSGAILAAVKGTINRVFGNIDLDIKKGDNLTPAATVYGNYGVFKFRKDVANQAIGNQDQGGFLIDNNGQVSLDQGPGSELNADRLDGNQGDYYRNASNLNAGLLDPARLENTTYAISISGTADTANRIFNETASLTSNPSPSQASNGVSAALRNNSATGLTDGGTTHGILTYRREATGNAAIQIASTDNDNLYLRGNSGGNSVYGNWSKIWSGANDGAGSGLDADKLDAHQGLWYQSGYNFGASQGGINKPMGDIFLPEVLGQDKMVFENFYLNDSGLKYTLYVPDFHVSTGAGGNINNGGTYTIYSDVGATNNIGSIVVDGSNGVQELTHTSGEIYSLITGSIAFVGANTNANIYVVGPNPGSKWTVTSSNLISSGSSTVIGLRDAAAGAKLQLGKASVSTTPTIDFRSSGQAPNYDVQMIISGGNTNDGNGTLRINTGDITVNGNTVWHAGNDGSSSQLDAHYLDGFVQSTNAGANTIARRDASGHLTVTDLYADQGIYSNTGTAVLQLAGGNGIDLGKATTNSLSIKGRNSSSVGYIRFGDDSNDFGWDGTKLSYSGVHFRNSRLGVGQNDPQVEFHVGRNANASSTLGSAPSRIMLEQTNNNNWSGGEAAGEILFKKGGDIFAAIRGEHTRNGGPHSWEDGGLSFWSAPEGSESPTAVKRMTLSAQGVLGINTDPSNSTTYRLTVSGKVHTDNQFVSTVATGTAPLAVSSTTVVTNLNADLLDGYSALNLPYLQGTVNTWISSAEGKARFFFSNNSHTYFRTGSDFFFRNNGNSSIGSINDNGCWSIYEGSDTTQSTYGLQVNQKNGINLNASEGLSSGQKSTVLRASGDKQWIDTYGVFKRNRQTIGENITVSSSDNCMTAGPITINNGVTITVSNGGSWSVV